MGKSILVSLITLIVLHTYKIVSDKEMGNGLFRLGIAARIVENFYITYKFWRELLDKFVGYYKKHHNNIQNSYKEAAEYFLQ